MLRRGVAGCILAFVLLPFVALTTVGAKDLFALYVISPIAIIWISALAALTCGAALAVTFNPARSKPQPRESAAATTKVAAPDVSEMVRVLHETLVLARGSPELCDLSSLDLPVLLDEVVQQHDTTRLKLASPQTSLHVLGDRTALGHVFAILIDNALACATRVRLRLDHGTSSVVVHVDDNGPGIPRSDRARLFDRLHQLATPLARRGRRSAELAVARLTIRKHGGDIVVGCSPDGGARFTVRLPLSVAQEFEFELAKAS